MRSITPCHGMPSACACPANWRNARRRWRRFIGSNVAGSKLGRPPWACGNGSRPWREITCSGPLWPAATSASTVSAMLRPEPTMATACSPARVRTPS
ncbi:hypothetical protein G6F24_017648 [Rhizopus arrhizus]|nr:hypothetical protein G6F24_017648 [Rhizopus arrhizus]